MLKADLHIHTKGDPQDILLRHTPMDVIKVAAKQNFEVLAFTWHNKIFDPTPLKAYAKKRGITLIPGIEATISGKHTLLYNISDKEMTKVKTHEDLYELKDHVVIGAPHPFFMLPVCLGKKIFEHKKLFDFIEHAHFYTEKINLNKKAVDAAKELHLPLVANSDLHFLPLFGKDYTLIDTVPTVDAILDALKKKAKGGNNLLVQPCTRPYTITEFITKGMIYAPAGLYRTIKGDIKFQKQ